MSLPVLANHIASRGRGDDSMLVHMTPGEVGGLQALARAHGGSLSVNPDTGLPEAGFLKSLLPMIAGLALAPLTAGTSLAFLGTPLGAGLAVGGLGTLATGSLKEGLMMGLGAYGGAGIGGSIANAGTGALSSAGAGANVAALPTASTADIAAMADVGNAATTAGTGATSAAAQPLGFDYASGAPLEAAATTPPPVATPPALPEGAARDWAMYGSDKETAGVRSIMEGPLSKATPTDTFKAGIKSIMDKPEQLFNKQNLKYGLAAAAPMALATPTIKLGDDEDNEPMIRPYRYDPYGGQFIRGTPYPAKQANKRFAEGGATGMAERIFGNIDNATSGSPSDTPEEHYRRMILQAYGDIGRTGFGTELNQIDQPGFDYWMNALKTGEVAPSQFYKTFEGTVQDYLTAKPDDPYSQYVQQYTRQQEERANPPPRTPTNQYDRLTGDSAAAYDYLMGGGAYPIRTTQPRVMAPYSEVVMGIPSDPATQRYIWDEERKRYSVNPDYVPSGRGSAEAAPAPAPRDPGGNDYYDAGGTGGDGGWAPGGLTRMAPGGIVALAGGGYNLGDYSDGGRLLKGPGDGVSDSIPAVVGNRRPARLADGEFVVPARIVSELGNGSTNAGAKKLYAMMDRIQARRSKTTGKGRVAVNSRADKMLPA